MKTKLLLTGAAMIFTLGVAHAGGDKVVTGSATVDFEKGSATLSPSEKQELRDLITSTKAKNKIDKVSIAVWSDQERPVRGDLSAADRKLADQRKEAIKDAIEGIDDDLSVKAYSMAEGTNWLARTFNTRDAELDSVFAKKDAEIRREDFKVFKNDGGPSKAVVVLKTKVEKH
ncbi:MAG: hypothetical protein K2Q26_04475 [Bdellovibrionales bacterium]|nr:hypothetical protein [Bdellovibrionales bacterium]